MPVITPPNSTPFSPYEGSSISLIIHVYLPQVYSLPVIAHYQFLTDPRITLHLLRLLSQRTAIGHWLPIQWSLTVLTTFFLCSIWHYSPSFPPSYLHRLFRLFHWLVFLNPLFKCYSQSSVLGSLAQHSMPLVLSAKSHSFIYMCIYILELPPNLDTCMSSSRWTAVVLHLTFLLKVISSPMFLLLLIASTSLPAPLVLKHKTSKLYDHTVIVH